jgi:hypothetical protein
VIDQINEIGERCEQRPHGHFTSWHQALAQIEYSKHLRQRLLLRRIEYELPKRIFEDSKEKYLDEETGHFIATGKVELYNKVREVMIAYVIEDNVVKILTIHPLQEGQKENRLKSGRWRKV